MRCAAVVDFRVDYVVVALRLHVDIDVREGCAGGWRLRSGRSAADPSPAAHGPTPERMLPEAARGRDLEERGASPRAR